VKVRSLVIPREREEQEVTWLIATLLELVLLLDKAGRIWAQCPSDRIDLG
jgi:hypothetical protein